MRFRAEASVGNADGVFDAAYDFGGGITEAEIYGTPEEIGAAVTRYLSALKPEACRAMQYGTDEFFVRLTITPDLESSQEGKN